MAVEIPEVAEFNVGEDSIEFSTKSNGDSMRIHGIFMSKENAAALAYLVNSGVTLKVEITENT